MKKRFLGYLFAILFIVFGFIIPMITNGDNFKCNSNGNCSYYHLIYYFKTNKTSFEINNTTNISCLKTNISPEKYHLLITTNGVKIEIPQGYSANRCHLFKSVLEKRLLKSVLRQNR